MLLIFQHTCSMPRNEWLVGSYIQATSCATSECVGSEFVILFDNVDTKSAESACTCAISYRVSMYVRCCSEKTLSYCNLEDLNEFLHVERHGGDRGCLIVIVVFTICVIKSTVFPVPIILFRGASLL